jgi:hypothetical protein
VVVIASQKGDRARQTTGGRELDGCGCSDIMRGADFDRQAQTFGVNGDDVTLFEVSP